MSTCVLAEAIIQWVRNEKVREKNFCVESSFAFKGKLINSYSATVRNVIKRFTEESLTNLEKEPSNQRLEFKIAVALCNLWVHMALNK